MRAYLDREPGRECGRADPRHRQSEELRATTLSHELPDHLHERGVPVSPGIGLRVAVAESAAEGWTITEYAPSDPADDEFRRLASFVRRELRKAGS